VGGSECDDLDQIFAGYSALAVIPLVHRNDTLIIPSIELIDFLAIQ
jgi:hypothetical protein